MNKHLGFLWLALLLKVKVRDDLFNFSIVKIAMPVKDEKLVFYKFRKNLFLSGLCSLWAVLIWCLQNNAPLFTLCCNTNTSLKYPEVLAGWVFFASRFVALWRKLVVCLCANCLSEKCVGSSKEQLSKNWEGKRDLQGTKIKQGLWKLSFQNIFCHLQQDYCV